MSVAADSRSEPTVLGDFILGEKLGEGGFGTIYRAEQRGLGRPAVIKLIRGSLTGRRDAVERFTLEARLAARFDHPYAAHIYAFGAEPDGRMWIAMELVNGTPLDEMLERSGAIPVERLVPLLERLCEAIQSAHDQGIVHRDIKPSNVMVIARAGRLMPKLLDFGIAKVISTQFAAAPAPLAPPRPRRPSAAPGSPPELDRTVQAATDGVSASGSLTQAGQLLGTPAYMAPEQWLDPAAVGPWSDQYALALLAYEALTGSRAYVGTTIEQLADLHVHEPLPALPPQLPPAVYAVLARATAKEPTARYPNLLELAAAFRDAVHGAAAESVEPVAILSPERRVAWSADAPQPIAEAVAALVAARTPGRIVDRCAAVASLLARWLGVIAVASRSQTGRLAGTAPADALELLKATRRRPLHDTEWLDLAAALTRPAADRAELWPVPELVTFLAGGAGVTALRALLRTDAAVDALDDAAAIRSLTTGRLAQLDVVLTELGWLLDYELARETKGALELWIGPRSDERPSRKSAVAATGDVVLLDADGVRVVRLSPLIQIAPPAAGQPEEMFVFAGPARVGDGARLCAYPRGFERDVDELWAWLGQQVIASVPDADGGGDGDRGPYPGLAAFTAADRESFVGRERDVDELVNRLRHQAVVVVAGPSGIGKTSFLAAGVVPALPPSWRAATIRPGADPLGALAAVIERVDAPPYRDGPRDARTDPDSIAAGLAAAAEHHATTLVVIVDQAEELFTMCDDAARDGFARAVVAASASPRVRVVFAMRDDFLCRAETLPGWRGVLGRGVQVLLVPGRDDLERMLVVPATRRGYELDDPELAREIVAAVAERPGALPLIAFTAAELWDRRDRHFHRLTRAAYDQIGGVTGALVQHADGVVDRMPTADRRLVRLAFRRMLTAEGTRALIGRVELVAALGGTAAAIAVIDRLLAARLVVSRDDDDGDRVEIVHETLVTAWPRLAEWRREDDATARLQERLAAAARHWDEKQRAPSLLWRGEALVDLRRALRDDLALTPGEDAFARASLASAASVRRRRLAAVGGAFAVLAVGVVGLTWANRRIAAQRSEAVQRLAAGFEDRGRLALADGDASRATLFLAEAARLGDRGPAIDLMADAAARSLDALDRVVAHDLAPIHDLTGDGRTILALDGDRALTAWDLATGASTHVADGVAWAVLVGDRIATVARDGAVAVRDRRGAVVWTAAVPADATSLTQIATITATAAGGGLVLATGATAKLWPLAGGEPLAEVRSDAALRATAIAPTGDRIATGDVAGGVRIWDARGGAVATCAAHGAELRALRFTGDGRALVSADLAGGLSVCDATTGATLHVLVGHRAAVRWLDLAPDGALVSASQDGTVRVWDLATGAPVAILVGHHGRVSIARFSPDGDRILTAAADGTARVWTRDGIELARFEGHASRITGAVWSADGAQVITASFDGSVRAWRVDRGTSVALARVHAGQLTDLQLSRDDRWAITTGTDHVAVIWDRAAGRIAATLHHDAAVQVAALAPAGDRAVTVDASGAARVWSVPEGAELARVGVAGATTTVFVDDATFATDGDDGAVHLWRRDGQPLAAIQIGMDATLIAVDPSGRWLVAADWWNRAKARVIDVTARRVVGEVGGNGPIGSLAIDAGLIATADRDEVRLWQIGTWAEVARVDGHEGNVSDVWFAPDGSVVTSGDDGKLLVWDRRGALRSALDTAGVTMVGFAASADGALFVTTGMDGSLGVWDTTTYQRLLTLRGHSQPPAAVRLTRDGTAALTGGRDGVLATWDLGRPPATSPALATRVRCRVPLRLDGDAVLPRVVDLADPGCR